MLIINIYLLVLNKKKIYFKYGRYNNNYGKKMKMMNISILQSEKILFINKLLKKYIYILKMKRYFINKAKVFIK